MVFKEFLAADLEMQTDSATAGSPVQSAPTPFRASQMKLLNTSGIHSHNTNLHFPL